MTFAGNGHGEALAAFGSTVVQNFLTALLRHPLSESVGCASALF